MKYHFEQTLKDIRSKEIENLKLKLKSEYEERFAQAKEEYKEKVSKHKKEIRKVLDTTVESLTKTYEDELVLLKKKNKESEGYITELKRSSIQKDGEIMLL